MYFEPNPIVFCARAKVVEAGLRFVGTSTYGLEVWSGLEEPPPTLKLDVVRCFRQGGDEIDPTWWTFGKPTKGKVTEGKADKKKASKGKASRWSGAWCVDLEFRGNALTKAIDKASQPPLRNFKAQLAAQGARSLYRAFASAERIQLYVVALDDANKRIPGSLGSLLIDLEYGK